MNYRLQKYLTEDSQKAFATKIIQKRKEVGLSVRDVAEEIGYSPAQITRLEREQRSPTLESIYAFSELFGIPFFELMSIAYPRLGLPKAKKSVVLPDTIEESEENAISLLVQTIVNTKMSEKEISILCDLIKTYGLSKSKKE